MEQLNKQRLIGILVLLSLAAILIPMLFRHSPQFASFNQRIEIPKEPNAPQYHQTTQVEVQQALPMPNKAVTIPDAWVVQLGAFSNQDNASRLIKRLRQQGFDAYSKVGGDTTKVFIGPETRKVQAEKIAQRLQQKMQIKGMVVKNTL